MRRALILAIVIVFVYGCKKSSPHTTTVTTPPDQPPAVTPVGTPVGNPVTKSIGPAGGSIVSADGRLQLTFPPNALTTNTDITIQPGTNNAPGGIGVAYHLMPDGTTFGVPVTLTFNYADSDANGTLPYFFYIAYQDSAGVWNADFKNRNVDTIARRVSTQIGHFSWWDFGTKFSMYAYPSKVMAKKTCTLGVEITEDNGNLSKNSRGEYGYSKLPPTLKPVPSSVVGDWSINGVPDGDPEDGTLSQDNNTETYTAPAEVDEKRWVDASGSINYDVKAWNNGQQVLQNVKFIVFTLIELLPNKISFTVGVSLLAYNTSGVYNDRYFDTASFQADIDLGDSTFAFSDFTNQAPDVDPQNGMGNGFKAAYVYDGVGLVNVIGGLGMFSGDSVVILLDYSNTVEPEWFYTDLSTGESYTSGGDPVPGYPSLVKFAPIDMAQKGTYAHANGITESWSATPIH